MLSGNVVEEEDSDCAGGGGMGAGEVGLSKATP